MSKSKAKPADRQDPLPSDPTPRPDDTFEDNAQPRTDGPGAPDPFGTASDAEVSATESPKRPLIPGIDLDSVALEEDYQEGMAGDDAPATVVVRKPSGQGYFRAHPTLYRNVRMLEVRNGPDRGFYLVAAAAKELLQSDENEDVRLFPARLTLCYSRDTGLFLWPLRPPEPRKNNQIDEWSQSALRICKIAETQWVKLFTRRGGNCYSYRVGEGIKGEPAWTSVTMNEVAGMAFEGRHLTDPNDPLIRRLLGKE
jgi:hypothetical protein